MIYTILLVTQVILCISLIVLILIQHGKGADAGAAFGGGASGTVFGSRGAGGFLSKLTSVLGASFFIVCLALAWVITQQQTQPDSVLQSVLDGESSGDSVLNSVPAAAIDIPERGGQEGRTSPGDIPE